MRFSITESCHTFFILDCARVSSHLEPMNTVAPISKRGGARAGAGRKKLEPTVSRAVRIKVSLLKRLEAEAKLAGMNFNAYVVAKLEGKAVVGNVVEAPAVVPIVEGNSCICTG
jgi:hypothetical protein